MCGSHDPAIGYVNELSQRFGFHLERWTRGRTPGWARDAFDPSDVVRDTLFEVAREADALRDETLLLRLRRVLYENVRARIRRARPELAPERPASEPPLRDATLGSELVRRYEAALTRLEPGDREAVIARGELGLPWPEVADLLEKSSVAAARLTVSRALVRLAREMSHERRR
jgi:DNA-directed RNA polymerase specialized sigma24 family protein